MGPRGMRTLGRCDVLVVGAGLAGTQAALAAARQGARVRIASVGPLFSGSSFFPGTWGLGLVGPRGEDDAEDLVRTVCRVGAGMADETLVRTLVRGIPQAVENLAAQGCELARPATGSEGERDYVPCFDHATRDWHGIRREGYARAVGRLLRGKGVAHTAGLELLDVLEASGRVCGSVFLDRATGDLACVPCGSMVLATGGLGGLFDRTLAGPDVGGCAHAIVLEHGGRLVNVEFQQIMCGLLAPARGVVFNERTFRYARLLAPDGTRLAVDDALLRMRSAHGPMTARLPDLAVDLAVAAAGAEGVTVEYDLPSPLPDFVGTYVRWARRALGPGWARDLMICHYAHASNGGVAIDAHARCLGAPLGLFACGELTGGMHGADRIGGLSSANALVFGKIAGSEAAGSYAPAPLAAPALPRWARDRAWRASDAGAARVAAEVALLRRTMSQHCLVGRDELGLTRAVDTLLGMSATTRERRLALLVTSALAAARAMLERRESRGAHYRADHPRQRGEYAAPIVVSMRNGSPCARLGRARRG